MGVVIHKTKKTGHLVCDNCQKTSDNYKVSSPAAPDLSVCEKARDDGWRYSIGFFAMLAGHTVACPGCST